MENLQQTQCRVLYTQGIEHEKARRYQEAQECYLQSATIGYGRSEFRLGVFFLSGLTGEIDKQKAFAYFTKAAIHENRDQAKAYFNLGIMLETGDGIGQNLAQACSCYEQAAKLGNTDAQPRVEELKQRLANPKQAPGEIPAPAVTFTTGAVTTVVASPPIAAPAASVPIVPTIPAPAPMLPAKKIAHAELVIHEEIGKGSFGIVYRATWRQSEIVAVKQLHAQLTEPGMTEFNAETNILANLSSQRLVRLVGICVKPDPYCLVLEYMPKGSLSMILQSKEKLSWPCLLQIVIDVAQGLSYLHQEHIIHRDLRSKNVLLDEHNRAKITNFGLSKVRKETAISTKTVVGSFSGVAPEIFGLKPRYSEASDVYSYGTLLWEVQTRKIPYSGKTPSEIRELIKSGKHEAIPSTCPIAYKQLTERCWDVKPEARPASSQLAPELQQQLAQNQAAMLKSWHCDPDLKPTTDLGEAYSLINVPTDSCDVQKVVNCYQHCPVPYMDIKSIRVIYNLEFNRAFQARLMALQGRYGNPGFTPRWSQENSPTHRQAVLKTLEQMSAPYQDSSCPNVKIVAMWHGTKPAILDSIFRTGFANLASTDPGFYGKGIYSTWEAEYAHRVYSKGALLVNFAACFSAYPVIDGDMPKLAAGANYQNYDGHFIPVKPANPGNPHETNYYPCAEHEHATYHELVVFESAQCLPRYIVELQPSLPKAIGAPPAEAKKKPGPKPK